MMNFSVNTDEEKPVFKVRHLFQDCVEEVIQWDGAQELDCLVENPYNHPLMGGRYYINIAPWRYIRVYEGDWLFLLESGFAVVCPDSIVQELVREESYDRLYKGQKQFDGPYLHYPPRAGNDIWDSQESVSEPTIVGDSGRKEEIETERPNS